MYSANAVIKISRIKHVGIFLAPALTLVLTLGGIIDFFPVKNDYFVRIDDIKDNPDTAFFSSTPGNSVVLNSFWFYHPASIAGRAIYNGYSYFTWSYGYNQIAREESAKKIYASSSKSEACFRLENARISYVELSLSRILHPTGWQTQFIPVSKPQLALLYIPSTKTVPHYEKFLLILLIGLFSFFINWIKTSIFILTKDL
jgi:hypothetical protein